MIKINNVTKKFKKGKGIFNVNVEFNKGNVYGILGPNGSGKSTIIKSIVGLYHLTDGDIKIEGVHTKNDILDVISYMPDSLEFPNTSLEAIIDLHIGVVKNFSKEEMYKLLETFAIDANEKFLNLSKGQKMAFRLSLALAKEASIYIFDEPLSGIDPVIRKKILEDILVNVDTENKLIIISSHELKEIDNFIDEVVIVKEGNIEGVYDIDDIKNETNLFDWYVEKLTSIKQI